jgi:signal transduction histidine kinase
MAECAEMSEAGAGQRGADGALRQSYWRLRLSSADRSRMLFSGAALIACGLIALPFVLALGQPSDAIPAESRLNAAVIGVVVFGLVAIVGVLAGILHAELRHRDQTESELAQKNAALAAILHEMPDGIQVFDRDGQLIAWNEQVFTLTDLDAAQRQAILTAPDRARAFRYTLERRGDYGPGDPDALVAGREATARSGQPMQRRRQGASGRWIEVRGVPTTDGGWLGSYRDISEEVARERELADAYERLYAAKEDAERASRTKSEFLANMSHELRTPLNAIIGFSDMIRGGMVKSEDKARSYASDIHSSGKYLLNLINDILEVSRIEAGKLDLQEEAVDLAGTVDAALRMIESEAARANVVILRAPGEPLPSLLADRRRVSQVLLNLRARAVRSGRQPAKPEIHRDRAGTAALGAADATPWRPSRYRQHARRGNHCHHHLPRRPRAARQPGGVRRQASERK